MTSYCCKWLHIVAHGSSRRSFRFVLPRPRKIMVADGIKWLQMAAERPVGFCLVTVALLFSVNGHPAKVGWTPSAARGIPGVAGGTAPYGRDGEQAILVGVA